MTTATTRLSLFKLFLPDTLWVSITRVEYLELLRWLDGRRSRTTKRNAYDGLYETFIWFPTDIDGEYLVPLGHLTRVERLAVPHGRIVVLRPVPSVICGRGFREPISGSTILQSRLEQIQRAC